MSDPDRLSYPHAAAKSHRGELGVFQQNSRKAVSRSGAGAQAVDDTAPDLPPDSQTEDSRAPVVRGGRLLAGDRAAMFDPKATRDYAASLSLQRLLAVISAPLWRGASPQSFRTPRAPPVPRKRAQT